MIFKIEVIHFKMKSKSLKIKTSVKWKYDYRYSFENKEHETFQSYSLTSYGKRA